MSTVALILPDFLLILAGFLLRRGTPLGAELWAGVEKLTYFVLFPALLFYANARSRIDLAAAAPMLALVVAALAAGMVLGLAGKALFRPPQPVFGAAFQCAFRFNSYIGLALAARLAGDAGVALMALAIGVAVPIVNVSSVWALARGRGARLALEIATNPLVLSCMAGIAWGAAGLPLPELAKVTLSRMGSAAIVLGLLAVGAALHLTPERAHAPFLGWILAVKLLALPAVVWVLGGVAGLAPPAFTVALVFAALPPAPAAYILAVRLGGDGRIAAMLVSYGVAASLVTLPVWLAAASGT
ncbi:MAG TPA: AEC family transporter [Burkholderiales bacterium]|nr:AEC family transporter [Burkholderiales bacterium]